MTISSIGSSAVASALNVQRSQGAIDADGDHDGSVAGSPKADAFRGDFASMLSAVKSGDMTAAQSALQSLQSDLGSATATYSPSSTNGSSQNPVADDLTSLFAAVKSGDVSGAQSALEAFKSGVSAKANAQVASPSGGQQPVRGHGRHHHHGGGGGSLESLVSSILGSSPDTSTTSTAASATARRR